MLKRTMTQEEIIDFAKTNFPKSNKILSSVIESYKYYQNLSNTTTVVTINDIIFKIFMDSLSKNASVNDIKMIKEKVSVIYQEMLNLAFNKEGLRMLGVRIFTKKDDGFLVFTAEKDERTISLSNILVQTSPEIIDAKYASIIDELLVKSFQDGKTINFIDYFILSKKGSQVILINNPQSQLEFSVNEIIRNKK
jgi:hypothetical protein